MTSSVPAAVLAVEVEVEARHSFGNRFGRAAIKTAAQNNPITTGAPCVARTTTCASLITSAYGRTSPRQDDCNSRMTSARHAGRLAVHVLMRRSACAAGWFCGVDGRHAASQRGRHRRSYGGGAGCAGLGRVCCSGAQRTRRREGRAKDCGRGALVAQHVPVSVQAVVSTREPG